MKLPLALIGFFLSAQVALPFSFAWAQDAEQLKALEKDLQASKAERDRLAQESVSLTKDLAKARETTITLAKDIQDQEYSILVLENRIAELQADVDKRSTILGRRDQQMRASLMALERLALHPADALTLTPLAPDDAVRTAILLRAAVPAISTSTGALQSELAALYRSRAAIVEQREKVAAGAAALVTKRSKLETMIAAKATQQTTAVARSADLDVKVTRLSREAEDLRALFAKLAEEKAKREAEERKAAEIRAAQEKAAREKERAEAKALAQSQGKAVDPAKDRVILKAPPGVAEAASGRLFSKARGTLPFPAVGKIIARYGEAPPNSGATGVNGGTLTKGLTISTRSGATVVSPFDGLIAFAGPFRGYGELLIIEHSEGYHTLLAGMAHIDGAVGARVLAGEPVGTMSGDAAPALYVELRRDGQPINPLPWLADRRGSDQLGQK